MELWITVFKMHILAVSDYILEDGIICGATRVLYEYLMEFHCRGAKVSLITLSGNPQTCQEIAPGYIIYRLSKVPSPYQWFSFSKVIREITEGNPVDLYLGHLPYSSRLLLSVVDFNAPFYYIFHSPWHLEYETRFNTEGVNSVLGKVWRFIGSKVRWLIEDKVVKRANNVIVLSQYMKETLKGAHSCFENNMLENIKVIPPGVNCELFQSGDRKLAREKLNLPQKNFIIFSARSLIPRSGISLALQAIAKVRESLPDCLYLIAGDGQYRVVLEALVKYLSLEKHVLFLGNISDRELPLYYQAADLFLLPTVALEGFGLVILEAWASALPVVGTPIGAISEVLSPITPEFILKDCTPDTMFVSLKKIADKPDELFTTGKKCYEYVIRNYSWSKTTDRFLDLLQQKL